MEKKSYVPKVTKYLQKEDGSEQGKSYPEMNCKWCETPLTEAQVYQFLSGKSKGTACSSKCSMKLIYYKNKEDERIKKSKKCKVCNKVFLRENIENYSVCSAKCTGVLASKRMKENNPMKSKATRDKVSKKLKEIGHKPYLQGGNGRGATKAQLMLYNEITKYDDSFVMEHIESTKGYIKKYKTPNHYKVDIASKKLMIAIEVDGVSHKSLKVKECDQRKTKVLILKGWKVLRFTNSQIKKELENCVQKVLFTIWK